MTGASLADRCRRIFRRSQSRDPRATDAARRLIDGDVEGALLGAQKARNSRNRLTRSEAYHVLTWIYLVLNRRDEAEAVGSVARRMRTPDRLQTIALVVVSGGPSAGAATAFIETTGILSLVAATRVFVDHDKLAEVRSEIALRSPTMERDALAKLEVGLIALGRQIDVDEVADRLAELGLKPVRHRTYASNLGKIGMTALALRYLQLAADRGLWDVERVMSDPDLADARAQPAFAAVRDRMVANGREAAESAGS